MNIVRVKSAKDVVWDALCRAADKKGKTDLTVSDLSELLVNKEGQATTGAIGKHATTHLLYSLQKGGLITFKVERVNTSAQTITDIRLTPSGLSKCNKYRLSVRKAEHQYRA